jgi:hypothetical protein
MTKSIQKKRHRKITLIFLAPILTVIYLLGWSLYCAGQSTLIQPEKTTNKTPSQIDNKDLETIPLPEEQTITN